MNDDLISRKALLQAAYEDYHYRATLEDWELNLLQNYLDAAPAVDPLTVFKQIGLVKEAFEMAKVDLMQVVQCKDCVHWETTKCPLCIVEFSELPDGSLHKHVIHNFVEDDFWCKKGERKVCDEESAQTRILAAFPEDVDLEHMARFAMQQALQRK